MKNLKPLNGNLLLKVQSFKTDVILKQEELEAILAKAFNEKDTFEVIDVCDTITTIKKGDIVKLQQGQAIPYIINTLEGKLFHVIVPYYNVLGIIN